MMRLSAPTKLALSLLAASLAAAPPRTSSAFPPGKILEAIGGQPADVITKAGWPGEVGVYRLDVRVPGGVQAGTAKLQMTAAWISSEEVGIAVR